jgi:hypothetical protein
MCKKIDELFDQRKMLVAIQSGFKMDSTDFNRYKNLLKKLDNRIYEASKNLVDPPPPSDHHSRHKEMVMVGGGVAIAAGVTAAVYLHFRRKE